MSNIDDLLNKLDEQQPIIESTGYFPAEGAQHAVGDVVAGKIVALGSNSTQYGTYQIATVDAKICQISGAEAPNPEGKPWALHLMGTVRQNFADSNELQVGGDIAMRYDGKVKNKDGSREYDSWACAYFAPSAVDSLPAAPEVPAGLQAMLD